MNHDENDPLDMIYGDIKQRETEYEYRSYRLQQGKPQILKIYTKYRM